MGNLLFWLGIGAAQKGAGSKPIKRRLGCLARCRYSDYGVDSCRSIYSVGPPTMKRR